jgi:hypothetical protein
VIVMLWFIGLCVLVIWLVSIVDVFRRHYSGWTLVGWLALIVLLPLVGSLIYWARRKPSGEDVERQYLDEADRRQSAERGPFDSTSMRP